MTALSESFPLMIIHDIFSLLISTSLLFSWIRKPILDTELGCCCCWIHSKLLCKPLTPQSLPPKGQIGCGQIGVMAEVPHCLQYALIIQKDLLVINQPNGCYKWVHCTTQPEVGFWRGFGGVLDSGFSLCTVPTYYCRSEYFYSQHPQVQNISEQSIA